jgi:xylose isomerase
MFCFRDCVEGSFVGGTGFFGEVEPIRCGGAESGKPVAGRQYRSGKRLLGSLDADRDHCLTGRDAAKFPNTASAAALAVCATLHAGGSAAGAEMLAEMPDLADFADGVAPEGLDPRPQSGRQAHRESLVN